MPQYSGVPAGSNVTGTSPLTSLRPRPRLGLPWAIGCVGVALHTASDAAGRWLPLQSSPLYRPIADITMTSSVPLMDVLVFQKYYRNYKKWCRFNPAPEVAPTKEQPSSIF